MRVASLAQRVVDDLYPPGSTARFNHRGRITAEERAAMGGPRSPWGTTGCRCRIVAADLVGNRLLRETERSVPSPFSGTSSPATNARASQRTMKIAHGADLRAGRRPRRSTSRDDLRGRARPLPTGSGAPGRSDATKSPRPPGRRHPTDRASPRRASGRPRPQPVRRHRRGVLGASGHARPRSRGR